MVTFDNSYARLPARFFERIPPVEAKDPKVVLRNEALAKELGAEDWTAEILSGTSLPDGADPIAQVYAAHQFGHWVPRLGDGRAILLGEVAGTRQDIQLKGAGRTPFSRNGDGKLWIGPALREYLISEYMHAVGVPTTRALAVTLTGDKVQREAAYPGAVLTRVASSHIRIGTFQYFAAQNDIEALRLLADHVRERHYPQTQSLLDLFAAIIRAQAELIANWMGLGFVHGVMNTDNMAVSGETIDYGPCAFIDDFSPTAVFSSIDRRGRYAYDNQAPIAHWNLAQLGSCLVPLLREEFDSEETAIELLSETLNTFPALYEAAYLKVFARKLGISGPMPEDRALIDRLLTGLEGRDFTNVFYDQDFGPLSAQIKERQDTDPVTPALIPRTHRIEQAIEAALAGDFTPAQQLDTAFKTPYTLTDPKLAIPPKPSEIVPQTFCGT